jgi:hypothetical protein
MKNKVFEIVKVSGVGAHGSPIIRKATGLLYWDEGKANDEARELNNKATEGLHYEVKPREVK